MVSNVSDMLYAITYTSGLFVWDLNTHDLVFKREIKSEKEEDYFFECFYFKSRRDELPLLTSCMADKRGVEPAPETMTEAISEPSPESMAEQIGETSAPKKRGRKPKPKTVTEEQVPAGPGRPTLARNALEADVVPPVLRRSERSKK